jgi:hypothetical protein
MQQINTGRAAGRKIEEGEVKPRSSVVVDNWRMPAEIMRAPRLVDMIDMSNEEYIIMDLKKKLRIKRAYLACKEKI